MGLTGGLVKNVFSRNRSFGSHETNVRNYGLDKRRWSSVRSYLCGDEFNSVLADADSASIRSSEATVTQPVTQDFNDQDQDIDIQSGAKECLVVEENQSLLSVPTEEEQNAAIIIQSAFRCFQARHKDEVIEEKGGVASPSWESVGTSVEVQTGGSVQEERVAAQHRAHQKARSHASKLKEDWDDSTVSSNIMKMRIQSRLEATTRRERALAYAFSQQLRICSKKKPSQADATEVNMGWSWLERWMATRPPPDTFSVEDRMSKQNEPISTFVFGKRNLDVAAEEKESCGSNEVSIGIDRLTITAPDVKDYRRKSAKNRLKAARSVSRRKTVPSYQISAQWMKKDCSKEAEQKVSSPDSAYVVSNYSTK